jgi:hypothetical protein
VAEREAPLGSIELRGGHPEVEQDAGDRSGAGPLHRLGQLVEAAPVEPDPVTEGGEGGAGGVQRRGVAIEAQEGQAGVGLEHGAGVAAAAEGGVHEGAGRYRGQQRRDALDHHRGVVESALLVGHGVSSVGARRAARPVRSDGTRLRCRAEGRVACGWGGPVRTRSSAAPRATVVRGVFSPGRTDGKRAE